MKTPILVILSLLLALLAGCAPADFKVVDALQLGITEELESL
jgi:type IV pilus biogenesis protein CpaD/CtpE